MGGGCRRRAGRAVRRHADQALGPGAHGDGVERNRAEGAFGFGVVFSDATLARIHSADPVPRTALTKHGVRLKGEVASLNESRVTQGD